MTKEKKQRIQDNALRLYEIALEHKLALEGSMQANDPDEEEFRDDHAELLELLKTIEGEDVSNKPKFTPGPWHIGKTGNGDQVLDANETNLIACTYGDSDTANARLTAAAPELYEIALKYIDGFGRSVPTVENLAEFQRVEALLKKIGGET